MSSRSEVLSEFSLGGAALSVLSLGALSRISFSEVLSWRYSLSAFSVLSWYFKSPPEVLSEFSEF